jgi:hypothetical protein
MNAYIISHAPFFLSAQILGLRAAYPGCEITVLAAKGAGARLASKARVVQSPTHGLPLILDWFFEQASEGPAVFLEYDVVPIAPVFGNWMNQRGIQERGQTAPMRGLWPAAFGWSQKADFNRLFFKTLTNPFFADWTPLIQDRAAVRGNLPECAEACDFRMIGDRFIHYVNGTARMSVTRNECFRRCLAKYGIEWSVSAASPASAPPLPAPTLATKAANFATSAAKHVAAGMPQATDEQVAARFAICQTCEHFDGRACKKCGCPVVRKKQFLSKLSWAGESCPVGKWGPVSS